jgi:hypothetical protein
MVGHPGRGESFVAIAEYLATGCAVPRLPALSSNFNAGSVIARQPRTADGNIASPPQHPPVACRHEGGASRLAQAMHSVERGGHHGRAH